MTPREFLAALPQQNPLWTISRRIEESPQLGLFRELAATVNICECGEPLVAIPAAEFPFFEPHAYQLAGAPYGKFSPYHLRSGVLERLRVAQQVLEKERRGYRLKIFDAFRPRAVQQYMVDWTIKDLAAKSGRAFKNLSPKEIEELRDEVLKIFAMPSFLPKTPPPHSTGAAVDLTLVDEQGQALDMGGEIDAFPPNSLPHFFAEATNEAGKRAHENRQLLARVMAVAGFSRLVFEWWHFHYGDRHWALLQMLENPSVEVAAIYGAVEDIVGIS